MMVKMWSWLLASTALLMPWASAQFPPEPEGITMLRSQFDNNITISYKEVGHPTILLKYHHSSLPTERNLRDDAGR